MVKISIKKPKSVSINKPKISIKKPKSSSLPKSSSEPKSDARPKPKPKPKPKPQPTLPASSNWLSLKGKVPGKRSAGVKRKHFEMAAEKRAQEAVVAAEEQAARDLEAKEAVFLYEDADDYFAIDCEMVSELVLNEIVARVELEQESPLETKVPV
jgi:hypothetical protein